MKRYVVCACVVAACLGWIALVWWQVSPAQAQVQAGSLYEEVAAEALADCCQAGAFFRCSGSNKWREETVCPGTAERVIVRTWGCREPRWARYTFESGTSDTLLDPPAGYKRCVAEVQPWQEQPKK